MNELLDWYRELPTEVKTMIALAGLGTPLGAIWFLKTQMFPATPVVWIILGVAGVMLIVALVVAALRFAFRGDR